MVVHSSALLGYRMQVRGKENINDFLDDLRGGAIFAGNHESVADAFLMGLVVPRELPRVRFLGKQSALWKNRVWGKTMDYMGVIPVRERKGSNSAAVQEGLKVLQKQQALGIFPEGHIRYSKKALEGKIGVARFALETGKPVVPVGIIGTDGVLPYGANWPSVGKKVRIAVGPPIFFDQYDKSDILDFEVLRSITDRIMHEIRILSVGYGINPSDASFLRCMRGIDFVVVPQRRRHALKSKSETKTVGQRFDEWLNDVSGAGKNERSTVRSEDRPPEVDGAPEKFMKWLDDQL